MTTFLEYLMTASVAVSLLALFVIAIIYTERAFRYARLQFGWRTRVVIAFAIGATAACAIVWLGGYSFNHRGYEAVCAAVLAVCGGSVCAFIAGNWRSK